MAEFKLGSLAEFAAALTSMTVGTEHRKHEALEEASKIVEEEAKRVLGTYDYGWPPLKSETIEHKATGDSPLLETGELRDSIEHTVVMGGLIGASQAYIGSNEDKAVWHEMGTVKIPPRPFLSGAAMHKEREVVEILGRGAVKGIVHDP